VIDDYRTLKAETGVDGTVTFNHRVLSFESTEAKYVTVTDEDASAAPITSA